MCRLHAEVLMLGVRQAWIDLNAVFTASPSGRHIALPESCRGGSRQVPRESGTFRFRGIEMARALPAAVVMAGLADHATVPSQPGGEGDRPAVRGDLRIGVAFAWGQ